MSQDIAASPSMNSAIIEQILDHGDLSRLSSQQRIEYILNVCDGMGLNPLTKPFEFIKLNNKLTLYCTRAGTNQIKKVNKVSLKITNREIMEGVYIVTAQATMPDGRTDESTGTVSITGKKGEALANAFLKAETKARRRVTLSIVGLGWLDESEVESIPGIMRDDHHTTEMTETHTIKPIRIIAPATGRSQQKNFKQFQAEHEPAHQPASYVIPFGKYKGKTLDEVGDYDLRSYTRFLVRKAEQDKKPIDSHGIVGIFCSNVDQYTKQHKENNHEDDISEKFANANLDNQLSDDPQF